MINKVKIYRLKLPLKRSYTLSYGKISEFDSVCAVLEINGENYCGAFTGLAGYFNFTEKEVWKSVNSIAQQILKKDESEVLKSLELSDDALLYQPIIIALERKAKNYDKEVNVPLTQILERSLVPELKKSGCYKIKVGMDVDSDIEFIKKVSESNKNNTEIRADANQGYSLNDAIKFSKAAVGKIIYLEQPFPIENWEWNRELIKKTKINVMIDEGISSLEDIKKAIEVGAKFVKVKLAKFGSIEKTIKAIKFAEKNGLKIIIGNGVDIDTSNYLEAIIWEMSKTKMAGEMNGFLKPLAAGDILEFDGDTLKANSKKKEFIYTEIGKKYISEFAEF